MTTPLKNELLEGNGIIFETQPIKKKLLGEVFAEMLTKNIAAGPNSLLNNTTDARISSDFKRNAEIDISSRTYRAIYRLVNLLLASTTCHLLKVALC
jgi:hypothetical protein